MEIYKGVETLHAHNRAQWRKWLEKNGSKKKEVWLILYHKKSTVKSVSYVDAVEEALCFGWIDSLVNKRDVESYYQRFTPRKPGSNWSKYNLERADRMISQGLMKESGLRLLPKQFQNL